MHPVRPSPLTLGTAQLAAPYGIANRTGQPSRAEAFALLETAAARGIHSIDTARAYGDSENIIGAWRRDRARDPYVITKCSSVARLGDAEAGPEIERSVDESFAALGVARIDVMLTHGAADLLRPPVAAALARLQGAGRIGAFGASAYDAAEIEALLAVPGLAAIQAPVHALDWRLADGGLVARCAERGILFFARSVFCQGLMFLAPDELPPHLRAAAPALCRFREIAAHTGLGIAGLAIGAVRAVAGISSLVIGAERPEQIASFSAAAQAALPDAATLAALRDLAATISHDLINPRRWPQPAS